MALFKKEIGGYIEFEHYSLSMLHEDGIKLNSGRHCLEYLIEAYHITSILLPFYICDSVIKMCEKKNLEISYYHIDSHFRPILEHVSSDKWVYVVNYYGQLAEQYIVELHRTYPNLIMDYSQAYFSNPILDINTLYTCRKFFGVADGGILYSQKKINYELEESYSYDHMFFLFGRLEKSASEFYQDNNFNNKRFANEALKQMSKTTENLLHSLDYDQIEEKRNLNFDIYYNRLKEINLLNIQTNKGPFMYPLYIECGAGLKKYLISHKVYIPTLWPNVINDLDETYFEYNLANNLVLLPCDQRYSSKDMEYVCDLVMRFINEKI